MHKTAAKMRGEERSSEVDLYRLYPFKCPGRLLKIGPAFNIAGALLAQAHWNYQCIVASVRIALSFLQSRLESAGRTAHG